MLGVWRYPSLKTGGTAMGIYPPATCSSDHFGSEARCPVGALVIVSDTLPTTSTHDPSSHPTPAIVLAAPGLQTRLPKTENAVSPCSPRPASSCPGPRAHSAWMSRPRMENAHGRPAHKRTVGLILPSSQSCNPVVSCQSTSQDAACNTGLGRDPT